MVNMEAATGEVNDIVLTIEATTGEVRGPCGKNGGHDRGGE